MCRVDYSDGHCVVLHSRSRTARKPHKCHECGREIVRGEVYLTERLIFEGEASTHKTCAHCQVVREWLSQECGGYVFGEVEEDIREHAQEGCGIAIARMAVGMDWKWTRKSGERLPIPTIPKLSAA